MTNYERRLQDMTLDQMVVFMNAVGACSGFFIDEEFECHSPENMSCDQCI